MKASDDDIRGVTDRIVQLNEWIERAEQQASEWRGERVALTWWLRTWGGHDGDGS